MESLPANVLARASPASAASVGMPGGDLKAANNEALEPQLLREEGIY